MGSQIKLRISPLSEYPQYSALLASWAYNEWYLNRDISPDLLALYYKKISCNSNYPFVFIAIENDFPVGMVSLKLSGLTLREDLKPWLSSLFVDPDFRGKGVANLLIQKVIEVSILSSFEQVYLFFDKSNKTLEQYYLKKNWEFYDHSLDNDGNMSKILKFNFKNYLNN